MDVPIDRQAELGLIGCCLLGGLETTCSMLDAVSLDCLYFDDTRLAFELLRVLVSQGSAVDEITLAGAWDRQPNNQLSMKDVICSATVPPSHAALEHFTTWVLDIAARRRLFHAANEVLCHVNDKTRPVIEIVSKAESLLFDNAPNLPRSVNAKECASMLIDDVEHRWRHQGETTGILTGLLDFDKLLDGLQLGEQTVIAARPSQGKTSLGLCAFARAALDNKVPAMFVSLEMGVKALLRRLASIHCRIDMTSLRRGTLGQLDMAKLAGFSKLLANSPSVIVDAVNGGTDLEIASSIRRAVRRFGIKLVVIDYLQKIRPSGRHEKRTYEVAEVSSTLKGIANHCQVALLTLAQLKRDAEGRLPCLSDLADSDQIQRDADVVGLLHRESGKDHDENSGTAKLLIAKNRDGALGIMDLVFVGRYCRFENATHYDSVPAFGK